MKIDKSMILRSALSLAAFAIAFALVAAAAVLADSRSVPAGAAVIQTRGCCIRGGGDPDAASAELQQAVANAIVQSGAEIREFSAPRPTGGARIRRLTAIVAFSGSQEATAAALGRLAALNPQVAIGEVSLTYEGQGFATHLYIVQWVRLRATS